MRRCLALLLLLLLAQPVAARVITGSERWQGEVRVEEPLRVEAGGRLTIMPGTRVVLSAALEIAGQLQASEVDFSGQGWPGLLLKGVGAETTLLRCRISGASTGITVIGGSPRLRELILEQNRVGIELRQKSTALVEDSIFRANSRVGLFLKDGVSASVRGNRFERQGKFGAYIYRAQPQLFRDNLFSDNPTGLMISHYGSDPLIESNRFRSNRTGVLVDRTARPQLRRNLFEGNGIGIDLYRRSDPQISRNRLVRNAQAIRVRYSSYPRIEENDFSDNQSALVLEFQSSKWEASKGSAARQQQLAVRGAFGSKKQSQVTEEQRRARDMDGTVDARNNWWGEAQSRLLKTLNKDANLEWIMDGRDTPSFEEGGQSYPLDLVNWYPHSAQPWTTGAFE